jgi:hypothetical protein
MFAQWGLIAFRKDHREARREPLITLGSAPLHVREFRSVVLGQLGEVRLDPYLDSDIAGTQKKAAALDADVARGPLNSRVPLANKRSIHRGKPSQIEMQFP